MAKLSHKMNPKSYLQAGKTDFTMECWQLQSMVEADKGKKPGLAGNVNNSGSSADPIRQTR
jgi:hypothetical protein